MRNATQALTVLAAIDPPRRALLDERLAAIAADLEHNAVLRPGDLPHTHFTRFLIIEDRELPALLAWEANHDGDPRAYLDEVVREVPAIDALFECCTGYPDPDGGARSVDTRAGWLRARAVRAAAFYTAYRGISHRQVVNDREVHDAIRTALDRPGARAVLTGLHPSEIQRRLCEEVRATHPDLDVSPGVSQEPRWLIGKVAAIAALLVLLPALLVIVGPWYLVLRSHERTDVPYPNTRPVHDERGLSALEDRVTQNQLTHLVDIKPGWFRLATLAALLAAIGVIARVYAVRGDLGGITSIHFARWVIIRDRRPASALAPGTPRRHRLLFFSNYDGSWESYLGEFVDRAAYALTAVWSNTVGFPRTEHLLGAGARDEEAFKQWTRRHQLVTQVWWSGVPDSTVQNIRDDIAIRRNLDRGLADADAVTWLRTL
ncbi:MAG: hypothetical protein M3680_34990 [Myxococcota bacterium]|nr:hypothetical protein [Myxococcota bacterium]